MNDECIHLKLKLSENVKVRFIPYYHLFILLPQNHMPYFYVFNLLITYLNLQIFKTHRSCQRINIAL